MVDFALFAGLFSPIWTLAAEATGLREILFDGVKIGIWYPSDALKVKQRSAPFEVEVARDAPIRNGRHEIVLFSHGNGGFHRNHYLTARALADAGYIVVAPQHQVDWLIGGPRTAVALDHIYLELAKALNAVHGSSEFSATLRTKGFTVWDIRWVVPRFCWPREQDLPRNELCGIAERMGRLMPHSAGTPAGYLVWCSPSATATGGATHPIRSETRRW